MATTHFIEAIPDVVARAPKTIATIFLSAFVLFLYGTSQVKLDSNIVELFKEGTSFRVAYEVVDEHMMGTGGLSIMMDFQQSDALQDPQVLQAVDRLQATLETKYSDYVVRTSALTDVVKDTLEVMTYTGNRAIPDSDMAVSQLLYMFNSANPEDRRALVSDDYSRSHVSVQMLNAGSYEYGLFFDEMQTDIDAGFEHLRAVYPDMDISVTGTTALMMRLADDLARTQFQSLLLAIFVISLLLMISLGSLQAGLLGMVPNLLPAIFAFGFLGLIGSALDTDTLLIAPLIIGIAVDDTIHFLTHYRVALARTKNMMRALRDTIKEVGQAVTFTTLILGLGFMTLGFSDYLGIAKVGWLDDYEFTLLDETTYQGRPVWVIQSTPTPERARTSRYSKTDMWIDQERLVQLRVSTYDRRGDEYKRFQFANIERLSNVWMARSVTVMNLTSSRLSNISIDAITFGVDIEEEFLTQRALTDQVFRERHLNALRAQTQ
ncbi:MAG: outer membrane lipoprotein-sorting protein [Natronospirillum sp.]